MRILKQILAYVIWTLVSFVAAFGYILFIFGEQPKSSKFFGILYDILFLIALEGVGLFIGLIIALLFIITDVFYLKSKLKNNFKSIIIRLLVIIIITLGVGVIHYILEKVVDVI